MEKILKFLNHLTALLLGPLLLLIKYLSIQFFVALSFVGLAIAFVVMSPVLFVFSLRLLGVNSTLTMIFGVLLAPVALVVSVCIVPLVSLYCLVSAITDALKVFFEGLAAAFYDGWTGIFENFAQPIGYFSSTGQSLLSILSRIIGPANNSPATKALELDDLKQENDAIEPKLQNIDEIRTLLQNATNRIQSDELKKAKALIHFHELTEKLKAELEHHYQLAKNLSEVTEAMTKKETPTLEDELFEKMELEHPVLLVKEYFDQGEWHAVPGSTKITDYNSLKTWFSQNAIIPTTRDSVHSPTPYQGKKCRYAYYTFSMTCKELVESSARIQQLTESLQQLSDQLDNSKAEEPSKSVLSDARHATFYKSNTDSNMQAPKNTTVKKSVGSGMELPESNRDFSPN